MTSSYRKLLLGGILCSCLAIPDGLMAASGCNTSQLTGAYDSQATNIALQNVLQGLATLPPGTTNATVLGFVSNPASLSGNLPGLGRFYLDGTGNIVGVTAASSTSPAMSTNVGKYTVNTDCSGSASFTSGAAYDIYLSGNGSEVQYERTDSTGGGEIGVLLRASSCVNLNYPGSFTFAYGGSRSQTGTSGTTAQGSYSAIGSISLNGSGAFAMSQSLYSATGVQRSTSSGSYTVGGDCSVVLSFSTASGSSSTGFVAPTSFRILMVNSTTGLLSTQPDATTTLTGTVTAQ